MQSARLALASLRLISRQTSQRMLIRSASGSAKKDDHGHGHGSHVAPHAATGGIDPILIHEGKVIDPEAKSLSNLGGGVGTARFEELMMLAGIEDPFDQGVRPMKRALSYSNANLVPATLDSRVVGCICERDSEVVNWFEVQRDVPCRCPCGYFFRLCTWEEWENHMYGDVIQKAQKEVQALAAQSDTHKGAKAAH